MTRDAVERFREAVLGHYRRDGRKFPWRENGVGPYAVLVSEMMLQQTQTERVVPKFDAWMKRFPDERSLAAASFADVLALWSGLGYNRRARYLHESAKIIARDGFPTEVRELERLPGIGPYTARAVAAFAFGKPEVFIETNIRSVFIFFFFAPQSASPVSDRDILPLVEETLWRENPRLWYYALMDYGAALKKKTENPSRLSAHYAKQGRFKGSLREARGAILRSLSSRGKSPLEHIALYENIDFDRIERASESLVAEGFIEESDGIYSIRA